MIGHVIAAAAGALAGSYLADLLRADAERDLFRRLDGRITQAFRELHARDGTDPPQ